MIISFASTKGGVGKSTLARTTAIALQVEGREVLLADLDAGQGTSHRWSEKRNARRDVPRIDAVKIRSGDGVNDFLEHYDYVVIDAAPHPDWLVDSLMDLSDLMVLPSGPSSDDYEPTIDLWRRIQRHPSVIGRSCVVLNQVGSARETFEARQALQDGGCEVLTATMPGQVSFRSALNNGLTLVEVFKGKLHDRASNVLGEIIEKIEDLEKAAKSGGPARLAA